MRFEKCLTCPAIKGKRCSGPKFMRASSKDLVEWLLAYMKLNGITNAQLATASNVPKGTIDGLKNRTDVRHETFLPLLKAAIEMTGGIWDDDEYCPLDHIDGNVAECQQEIIRLSGDILTLTEKNLSLSGELKLAREEYERSVQDVKERTRAIYALFGLCAGLVLLLLVLLLK